MTNRPFHLFVSLSPHGFGHAAMTAPVLNALRRRLPNLRLTLQTAAPMDFLRARIDGAFEVVRDTPDFGARMQGPLHIDAAGTAADYLALHQEFDAIVEREAARLRRLCPDGVLSNISYVALAAAARADIPAMAYSCLDWAGIYAHFCGDRPEAAGVLAQITAAYDSARVFLQATPAMPMPSNAKLHRIGPVAERGRGRRVDLRRHLGLDADTRVALVGFGGIELPLPFEEWPRVPGWHWLVPEAPPGRSDLTAWPQTGYSFKVLSESVDAMVGKPGYGTFVECAVNGTPLLYVPRPQWPESIHLEQWLLTRGRALSIGLEDLFTPRLALRLQSLLSLPAKPAVEPSGTEEAAAAVAALLSGEP